MTATAFRGPALSVLSIMLLLVLSSCGPGAATVPKEQPTDTPVVAQVPKQQETATPPHSTYPAATDEDLQLIKKALANSSVPNLKRYHFVSTMAISGWETTVSEGDVVAPEGQYLKVTQGDSVEESLVLGNTSYCKDSSGKWIVAVADLEAHQREIIATAQAEQDEFGGFPEAEGTRVSDATAVAYDWDSGFDLMGYGNVEADRYDFYNAGTDTIEGVLTRHFTGEEDWPGDLLPPGATVTTGEDDEARRTLSLWIDAEASPEASYVRKLEHTFHFSRTRDMLFAYMEYGCGEVPPVGPTPTLPPFRDEGNWTTTVVYSRLNDPSLALPRP